MLPCGVVYLLPLILSSTGQLPREVGDLTALTPGRPAWRGDRRCGRAVAGGAVGVRGVWWLADERHDGLRVCGEPTARWHDGLAHGVRVFVRHGGGVRGQAMRVLVRTGVQYTDDDQTRFVRADAAPRGKRKGGRGRGRGGRRWVCVPCHVS